jgi:hypothetical protein
LFPVFTKNKNPTLLKNIYPTLNADTVKISVFWNTTSYSVVDIYKHFRELAASVFRVDENSRFP